MAAVAEDREFQQRMERIESGVCMTITSLGFLLLGKKNSNCALQRRLRLGSLPRRWYAFPAPATTHSTPAKHSQNRTTIWRSGSEQTLK